MDVRPAEMRAQSRGRVQRSRPPDEGMAVTGKLELELGVSLGLVPDAFELVQGAHEGLGHVLAAESAETSANRVFDQLRISLSRTAWTKARTLSGSLMRTEASTPLETSTP